MGIWYLDCLPAESFDTLFASTINGPVRTPDMASCPE